MECELCLLVELNSAQSMIQTTSFQDQLHAYIGMDIAHLLQALQCLSHQVFPVVLGLAGRVYAPETCQHCLLYQLSCKAGRDSSSR
jgi:hypothetical protein